MIITIVLQFNKRWTSLQEGLVLWSLVSLKCARDSVTVFHLQIIYKLQEIEILSSLSVNLCVCILDHGNTNIRNDGVKVIDFPQRLQNHVLQ